MRMKTKFLETLFGLVMIGEVKYTFSKRDFNYVS